MLTNERIAEIGDELDREPNRPHDALLWNQEFAKRIMRKSTEQLTSLFIAAAESKARACSSKIELINPFNDCEFEAVKYAIEVIQSEIKAQAIDEVADFVMITTNLNPILYEKFKAYANKLRGEE
jgi:hypothetical protein